MKKINFIFTLIVITLFASSCETYDDYNTERQTIIGFLVAESSIAFNPGQTDPKTVEVPIYITEVSGVDRSFTVSVVSSETTVASENYSFDSTLVIPANSNQGVFTFTANNISLSTEDQPVVVMLDTISGVVYSNQTTKILIKKRV